LGKQKSVTVLNTGECMYVINYYTVAHCVFKTKSWAFTWYIWNGWSDIQNEHIKCGWL
jgi:hypothetical protein